MISARRGLWIPVICTLVSPIGLAGQPLTQDWPQWRGPNRDGSVSGFRDPSPWPETLKQQWRIEVGLGYATPLLVGQRV